MVHSVYVGWPIITNNYSDIPIPLLKSFQKSCNCWCCLRWVLQVSATGSSSMNAAGRNATVTSLVVCCGFAVCWSISQFSHFLSTFGVIGENLYEWWLLVQLNSCINPFIYAAKYRDFQAGVRKMLKKNSVMPSTGVGAAGWIHSST